MASDSENRVLLQRLSRSAQVYRDSIGSINRRVYIGPTFNFNRNQTFHDVIMANLFYSLGAEVTYLSGYDLTDNAYPLFGGMYVSESEYSEEHLVRSHENLARSMFPEFVEIVPFENHQLDDEDQALIDSVMESPLSLLEQYTFEGVPLGKAAANMIFNMYAAQDLRRIETAEQEMRELVSAGIRYYRFYLNAITAAERGDPRKASVFSHDSFLMPWCILMSAAQKAGAMYYCRCFGNLMDTHMYATNQSTKHFREMDDLWRMVKNIPLTDEQDAQVRQTLVKRKEGNVSLFHFQYAADSDLSKRVHAFASEGPTAVLYGGVHGDTACLEKDIFTEKISDANFAVIKFFEKNPNYRLIVKAHPGEVTVYGEKVPIAEPISSVFERFSSIPDNVLYLEPRDPLSVYELQTISKCSVVFTSTVGIESAIYGIPPIVMGKAHYRGRGFSVDVSSYEELDDSLHTCLQGKHSLDPRSVELAARYYYRYLFNYFHDVGIPSALSEPRVECTDVEGYLRNQKLATVVDCILWGDKLPQLGLLS